MDEKKVPLTQAKRDAAIKAMEAPCFFEKLTVRVMKLAEAKGFYNPFGEDVNLPGGESAAGLALAIIEKALDGTYTWDDQKHPDFYWFCCSRAESILSNWLQKNRKTTTLSPLLEEGDGEEGAVEANPVNCAKDGADLYEMLRFRDGGKLGDQLLEDFALDLKDGSQEQIVVMAIHDDRLCIERRYCLKKLGLSEGEYDSAIKRIRRAGGPFYKEWCRKNNLKQDDRSEAR
jgi:hypothetical protein